MVIKKINLIFKIHKISSRKSYIFIIYNYNSITLLSGVCRLSYYSDLLLLLTSSMIRCLLLLRYLVLACYYYCYYSRPPQTASVALPETPSNHCMCGRHRGPFCRYFAPLQSMSARTQWCRGVLPLKRR